MIVSAYQFDVRAGDPERNLAAAEEGLHAAAAAGAGLVCLPEMWPTSFPRADGVRAEDLAATERAVERVAQLSRELELVVCGTGYAVDDAGGAPSNRMHVFDRGERVLTYDKVHLHSPTAEDEAFRAGVEAPPVVETSAGRLGGVICYDLRFPEVCRMTYRAGVEVLVVCAQWPVARAAHWRALAVARAVENQCFVVACNRTGREVIGRRGMELSFPGNSLVAAPTAEVLAEGHGREGLVAAEIELDAVREMRVRVPIGKDRREAVYARWEREVGEEEEE